MGTYVDIVNARALSTTEFVTLNGGGEGVQGRYTMNANAKTLVAVAPFYAHGITAAQAAMIELRITSRDAKNIDPYSIFAVPSQGALGILAPGLIDSYMKALMPINAPVNGNDKILFEGRALITNTIEPLLGALIYWSDQESKEKQIHAQVTARTAVPTTAVPTSGPDLTVTGSVQQRLKAIQHLFTCLVLLTVDRRIGFFSVNATGLEQDNIFPAEPQTALLGATGGQQAHLGIIKDLDNLMDTPTTVESIFTQTEAALAASFATGILYEDA